MRKVTLISIFCALALSACATTNGPVNVPAANQANMTPASINNTNNDFMFRSPPTPVLQARGLAR